MNTYFAGALHIHLPLWLSVLILGMFVVGGLLVLLSSLGVLLGLKDFWHRTTMAEKNSSIRSSVYADDKKRKKLTYYKQLRGVSIVSFITGILLIAFSSKGNFATINDFVNSLGTVFAFYFLLIIMSIVGFFYSNIMIRNLFQ